ncbi:hypothetical protein COCNU_scaffold003602G000010 [Cocos nucifera]|nr:hypothetical protein [Cocos nucifera]
MPLIEVEPRNMSDSSFIPDTIPSILTPDGLVVLLPPVWQEGIAERNGYRHHGETRQGPVCLEEEEGEGSRKEVISTTYADIVEGESLPPELANLPTKDCMPDPSTDERKERRKGKVAIVKKANKAHRDEPSWSSDDDQGMDPLDNPDIIQNLIDKFALLKEVDRLANLDQRQFI